MAASCRNLRVWQLATELVIRVYERTRDFPKPEIYGLIGQMRRAAVSIPSNIVEGKGRFSDRDGAHFFCHARGSQLELETPILVAQQLEYLSGAEGDKLIAISAQLGRTLNALIHRLQDSEKPRISVV